MNGINGMTYKRVLLLVYSKSAWLNVMMQIFLCVLFMTREWAFPIFWSASVAKVGRFESGNPPEIPQSLNPADNCLWSRWTMCYDDRFLMSLPPKQWKNHRIRFEFMHKSVFRKNLKFQLKKKLKYPSIGFCRTRVQGPRVRDSCNCHCPRPSDQGMFPVKIQTSPKNISFVCENWKLEAARRGLRVDGANFQVEKGKKN